MAASTRLMKLEAHITKSGSNEEESLLPCGSFDTHVHVFDPTIGPYAPGRARQGSGIVLVQPSPYKTDCTVLMKSLQDLRAQRTAAYGIAVIDLETITDHDLKQMHDLGVRGIRLNFQADGKEMDISHSQITLQKAAARIRHLPGWMIQLFVPGHAWDALFDCISTLPVPIIADHLGGMQGASKLQCHLAEHPLSQPGFSSLITLAKGAKVIVKISGLYRASNRTASHFDDTRPIIEAFAKEIPERCIWGSDWPHTGEGKARVKSHDLARKESFRVIDNQALLRNVRQWVGGEVWGKIVRDNPARLFRGTYKSSLRAFPSDMKRATADPSSPAVRRHRPGLSRSVAACERCRRRKQKCDGKTPTCGTCEAVGAPCVPSSRLVVQAHSDCDCEILRIQLQSLQKEYDALLQVVEQLRSQKPLEHDRFDAAVEHIPCPGASPAPDRHHISGAGHGLPPPSDPLVLNFDRSYTGRILRPTFTPQSKFGEAYRSALSSAWDLWGDDVLNTDVPACHSNALPSGFDNAAYENLVDVFFERRWPYLPVLHQPSFVSGHLKPFLANSVSSPISNFLVNVVCAIATTERSPTRQENNQLHRVFFNRAIQDMHVVIQVDDFECVQCLLLLCMYGHNEPQSVNMWYITGLALQLALGIDLHRKECLAGQSLLRSEMFKRVFWCAYVMSCSMAINMGRPLGIHENDITIPPPSPLTDEQLDESFIAPEAPLLPQIKDTSTFIHIIQLRKVNARVYTSFHSVGRTPSALNELEATRSSLFSELENWLIMAPRYVRTSSTFQSQEWFQIAFHHAVLSLYRPSRAVPMPSSEDIRLCMESAIGLINSYSSLYARNRIKYTFVAINSLFMAAVTMLYALRASPPLRHELSKPVVQTNISTFLTLFRGISNGRAVGEKCSMIIERLGKSILTLFDEAEPPGVDLDTEFQSWFGLHTHTFSTPKPDDPVGELPNHIPDVRFDGPWEDLFVEGVALGSTDAWSFLP
ncbi:uncharacterized protein DSM5745_07102 [Aspergillus mulundensis]|uniref:Zn(2)-C6 fungal-type domain-containing protein n=1 Tax=Aspergillus mulundensis TaxID=1810919 RepID=A0A3D8RKE6_9EURO|nr:hypothetical protein DSM5745_07102 [Aspergillus mulundensis]RDW74440.1 hypothetical protein DSM5745_07102 [Aspergillus mulundensis]